MTSTNTMRKLTARLRQLSRPCFGLIFITVTTYVIFKTPVSIKPPEPQRDAQIDIKVSTTRSAETADLNFSVIRKKKQPINFVVFDGWNYTGSLKFLNNTPSDWLVLVVNLHNKTQLLSCSNCLLLNHSWIHHNVVDRLTNESWTHIAYPALEKMAAYVYVLSQGASWIYTTNTPEPISFDTLSALAKHEVRTAPVYQGPGDVLEPCSHFMDTFTWDGLEKRGAQGRYNVKVVSSHSVHMVVNDCFKPGMDKRNWKNALDVRAPTPYVMPGTLAAIDFNNVLVSNLSAWTLVASLSNTAEWSSRNSISLNMIVQRAMWETNNIIGFIPAKPQQESCPTCNINNTIHLIGKDYLKNLTKLRCDGYKTVLTCFVKIASDSTLQVPNATQIRSLVSSWVNLLNKYRIETSDRVSFSDDRLGERTVGIPVYFTAAKSMHTISPNITIPSNVFSKFCRNGKGNYPAHIPKRHPIEEMLLIIIFNFPQLVSHISLLEYSYGRHFKHVLYCGESMTDFSSLYQHQNTMNPVSFVEIQHHHGYWGQDCMSAAIKMNYNVTGYLQMSDDVIMNVWNLYSLPKTQPWFQSSIRVAHIDRKIVPDVWVNKYWWPWTLFCGQQGAVRVYNFLQSLRPDPEVGDRVSNFLENLYNITNCDRCLLYEASDIFYLPASLAPNYIFFSDIFTQNQVFLEITIPTILAGITSDSLVYRLRGSYLWFQDRERSPYVYTAFDHFYHAWKFSKFSDPKSAKFYCDHVLAKIDLDVMAKGEITDG